MKPVKNQYYCQDCARPKMLFATEKKADNFIKFNKDEIEESGNKVPVRSYFCQACGGWHVTSNPNEEHFRITPGQIRQLTKMARIVELRKKTTNHRTFLIRKEDMISEAKELYARRDYLGSLNKCREALKLLEDNGKDWWRDNWYVKRLMYDNLCCEASSIDECLAKDEIFKAQNIISHCGCVMKELESTDGFVDYRKTLSSFLSRSIEKVKKLKECVTVKEQLKNVTKKIDKAWMYLSENELSKVRKAIERYTTELVTLSNNYTDKETLLPVINNLYSLREAYISKVQEVA